MRRLRLLAPVVAIAVIAVAVLLVTGASHRNVREYPLRVPNQEAVTLLYPSNRVCEGPVSSPRTFTGVAVWGGPAVGVSAVRVTVKSAASGRPLATGSLRTTAAGEHHVTLTRPVSSGTRVRVCLTSTLDTFSLDGAPVSAGQVTMTGHGHHLAFSLALVNDHHSLLGSLPVAFGRASVFKLSWLGSWTFWVLAIALLASFAVAVAAVASAASEDADDDR
jgi:hypothetical protein